MDRRIGGGGVAVEWLGLDCCSDYRFFLNAAIVAWSTHAASGSMLMALGEFLVARSFATYEAIPLSAYTDKFDAYHVARMPLNSNPSPGGAR